MTECTRLYRECIRNTLIKRNEGKLFYFYLFIIFAGLPLISFSKKDLFICLFMAVLGLHCCTWAFSSCSKQGLLIVVASLVSEHGL